MTNAKQLAGERAVDWVQDGMTLGLGTGSTVYYSLQKLGQRIANEGLKVRGIPSSEQTAEIATEVGIPLIDFASAQKLDLYIDGADEVDPQLALIKGGGGALFREKMLASISERFIVVAHDAKYVPVLGKFPLPIEVVPFGWEITLSRLQALGVPAQRREKEGEIFISDNANYIIDCQFDQIPDPASLNLQIIQIPGVVETGLFINMAHTVIVAAADGEVKILEQAEIGI